MATAVYHVGLGVELNLTEPDLGYPEDPSLWERLHGNCPPGTLQCPQCLDERPESPQWMYLRERNGRREAVHHNPKIDPHTSGESDAHKALKERIARAGERGGFEVVVEDRPKHGRRRTDVLIRGPKVKLGCEPQLSQISQQTLRKRSRIASTDGVTPLWVTDNVKSVVIDRAPWARFNKMSWHQYLTNEPIPILGGYRTLTIVDCERTGTVCPDKRLGRRCTGWHGSWRPHGLASLDDLVVRAAGAELVPVRYVRSDGGSYWFWVPATDLERVESAPEPLGPGHFTKTVTTVAAQPRPVDRECRYLDEIHRKHRRRDPSPTGPGHSPPITVALVKAPDALADPPGQAPAAVPPSTASNGQGRGVILDWSASHHFSAKPRPCHYCGGLSHLVDDERRPSHKVCAERHIAN